MRWSPFTLVLVSACGLGLLEPDFDERLTRFGGCADVIFFAVDSDDELMVTFRADGLVAAARETGGETVTAFGFPSAEVELELEQGSRVSDATCDDVIENSGPRVRRSWTAVSGTATLHIRPMEESGGGRGDLLLEDVVFAAGSGDEVTVERLEWVDISIGWFPG